MQPGYENAVFNHFGRDNNVTQNIFVGALYIIQLYKAAFAVLTVCSAEW